MTEILHWVLPVFYAVIFRILVSTELIQVRVFRHYDLIGISGSLLFLSGDDIVSLASLCIGCLVPGWVHLYFICWLDIIWSRKFQKNNDKVSPKRLALIIKQKNNEKKNTNTKARKNFRCSFAWLLTRQCVTDVVTRKGLELSCKECWVRQNLISHFPTFLRFLFEKIFASRFSPRLCTFLWPFEQVYSVMNALTRRGRGLLVAFEGCDRSGKSTQCQMLVDYLKSTGRDVAHLCFPGELM